MNLPNIAILPNGQIVPLPDWSKVGWVEKMRKDAEEKLKNYNCGNKRTTK